MKKLFALLLVLGMLFSLAACGGGDDKTPSSAEDKPLASSQQQETPSPDISQPDNKDNETPTPDTQQGGDPIDLSGFLGTKTGKFYSRFANSRMYMEYEMEMEGQKFSVISASNGDRTYSETKMGGTSLGVNIMVGEDMYTIDHASKTVIKMSLQANAQTIAGAVLEESDVDMGGFKTGTREIDGKTYDTEELIVEGASAIYCFDGDDLAYIVSSFEGQEAVMKIVEATDKVDDSLFEIPEDYNMMEL